MAESNIRMTRSSTAAARKKAQRDHVNESVEIENPVEDGGEATVSPTPASNYYSQKFREKAGIFIQKGSMWESRKIESFMEGDPESFFNLCSEVSGVSVNTLRFSVQELRWGIDVSRSHQHHFEILREEVWKGFCGYLQENPGLLGFMILVLVPKPSSRAFGSVGAGATAQQRLLEAVSGGWGSRSQIMPRSSNVLVDIKFIFQESDKFKAVNDKDRFWSMKSKDFFKWLYQTDQHPTQLKVILTNALPKPIEIPMTTGDEEQFIALKRDIVDSLQQTQLLLSEIRQFTVLFTVFEGTPFC